MSERHDEASGIRRNVDSIHERRRRLRAVEAIIETGMPAASHYTQPSEDGPPTTLATANARLTARVAQTLDRFGQAVVDDIAGAAERAARLQVVGADIARIAGRERRQSDRGVIDVDVVKTKPEEPSSI